MTKPHHDKMHVTHAVQVIVNLLCYGTHKQQQGKQTKVDSSFKQLKTFKSEITVDQF